MARNNDQTVDAQDRALDVYEMPARGRMAVIHQLQIAAANGSRLPHSIEVEELHIHHAGHANFGSRVDLVSTSLTEGTEYRICIDVPCPDDTCKQTLAVIQANGRLYAVKRAMLTS